MKNVPSQTRGARRSRRPESRPGGAAGTHSSRVSLGARGAGQAWGAHRTHWSMRPLCAAIASLSLCAIHARLSRRTLVALHTGRALRALVAHEARRTYLAYGAPCTGVAL